MTLTLSDVDGIYVPSFFILNFCLQPQTVSSKTKSKKISFATFYDYFSGFNLTDIQVFDQPSFNLKFIYFAIMGNAAAVISPRINMKNEDHLFAFNVLHYDLQHGALASKLVPENPNPLPEKEIFNRIDRIWRAAIQEKNTTYIECLNPAVINYKHSLLTSEEIHDIDVQILKEVIARDRSDYKRLHPSKATTDYSQSFGGTAEDTKNEKDAADILRGGGANDQDEMSKMYISPYIIPPNINHHSERLALRRYGHWLRYLSANGCYMYFNTMSHELLSNRPDEYEEHNDVGHISTTNGNDSTNHGDGSSSSESKDPTNGLPHATLETLHEEIEKIIVEQKKTPLLIDATEDQVLRTFYSYKACLEDISSMTIPFGKSGVKREDIMERCRKKLVAALKSGKAFVLYLGDVSIEHADLKGKLCKKVK
jgi:hypothetical protein